jgi:hypothetical protein
MGIGTELRTPQKLYEDDLGGLKSVEIGNGAGAGIGAYLLGVNHVAASSKCYSANFFQPKPFRLLSIRRSLTNIF